MKDLSRTWLWTGKQFEYFREKKNRNSNLNNFLDLSKNWSRSQRLEKHQLNMAFVDSKRYIEKKTLKREIRSKQLELWKSRFENSSIDMLNLYVVSVGCDMANETYQSATPRSKSTTPPLQRKVQKMEVLPKTRLSPKLQTLPSDGKKNRNNILKLSKTASGRHGP